MTNNVMQLCRHMVGECVPADEQFHMIRPRIDNSWTDEELKGLIQDVIEVFRFSYRERFGAMPPLKHDKDLGKSEVCAWIVQVERMHGDEIELDEAYRRFKNAQSGNKENPVFVFDTKRREWRGCDYQDLF
jgi:hypothetical protein